MKEKVMNPVISAVVGGIVGAAVVFLFSGKTKFSSLEVADLKITNSATLLNAEGKDDVVIREGSVLANNVILGKKFVGTQYQGHVFVGNRIFTSPDDLVTTPMEQWKFFTEMGSSRDAGGEMIIRSVNGPNIVGQPANSGAFLWAGFNPNNFPEVYARSNTDGTKLPVPFLHPRVGGPTQPGSPETSEAAATAGSPESETPRTAANIGADEMTHQ